VLFGIEILVALFPCLVLLDHDAVGLGVGVFADARDLPGDLQTRRPSGDAEAVILLDVERGYCLP